MSFYLIIKTIHLLAVVAFLGNITTGLFWMRIAVKTNDVKIIHHTASGIIASDRLFTIPGVIIITAGGIGAAIHAGIPLLRTGWIFWPLVLFSLSGIFFSVKVAPLQTKMKRYLETSIANNTYEQEKFRPFKTMGVLGLYGIGHTGHFIFYDGIKMAGGKSAYQLNK